MKNAPAMYANAVPNLVEQTKNTLLQSNLNLQKDLNEVAVIVAGLSVQDPRERPAEVLPEPAGSAGDQDDGVLDPHAHSCGSRRRTRCATRAVPP